MGQVVTTNDIQITTMDETNTTIIKNKYLES